jgi:hypothetical protein
MIQVMRIPMAKTKLAALSKDERVLLFLLGYVSNQTMMLEKLMLFSGNRDPKEFLTFQTLMNRHAARQTNPRSGFVILRG